MKLRNWKGFFSEFNLCKGLDIVEFSNVKDINVAGNRISATVLDRERYYVDIVTEGELVHSVYCTCHYAQNGGNCCHIAALLYELEAQEKDEPEEEYDDSELEQQDKLMSVISKLTEAQAKSVIRSLAREDSNFRNRLILRFSENMKSEFVDTVVSMIHDCSYPFHDDFSGNMGVNDDRAYVDALVELLEKYVPPFLDSGLQWEAFYITAEALRTAGYECICSTKAIEKLGKLITGVWSGITSICRENLACRILDELRDLETDDMYDIFVGDIAFKFRNEAFKGREYIEALVKERLTELESDFFEHYDKTYLNNIHKRDATFVISKYIEGYGTDDAIEAFAYRYCYVKYVCDRVLGYYREKGMKDKELTLLLHILESDNLDLDHTPVFSGAALLKISGRAYEVLNELKSRSDADDFLVEELVIKHRGNLIDHLDLLKGKLPSWKWKEVCKRIYARFPRKSIPGTEKVKILNLMLDEGEYEIAFASLEKHKVAINIVSPIIRRLVEVDVDRAYEIHVNAMLCTMGRGKKKDYPSCIKELEIVRDLYPDGDKRVNEIILSWKKRFPRKICIFEELKKAGLWIEEIEAI